MKPFYPVTHFFWGLSIGLVLYAAHLFVIGWNLPGKPTPATNLDMALGLLWPVAASIYGLMRASSNPVLCLKSEIVSVLIGMSIVVLTLINLFFIFGIMMSGYC